MPTDRSLELGKAIAHATWHQHVEALHDVLAWCESVRAVPKFEAASDAVMDLLADALLPKR